MALYLYTYHVIGKGRVVTFNLNQKLVGCELGLDASHNLFVSPCIHKTSLKVKIYNMRTFILTNIWRNRQFSDTCFK